MDVTIIKLGGSVVTAAEAAGHFNRTTVLRLGRELKLRRHECLVVHGTGHVGKPPAIAHGYLDSGLIAAADHLLALRIKRDLAHLNQKVIATMLEASVPVMPMEAAGFFNDRLDGLRHPAEVERLMRILRQGIVPVFHGDLVPVPDGCFRVFSSDVMVRILAEALGPRSVLFLSDVPGVLGRRPAAGGTGSETPMPTLGRFDLDHIHNGASDGRDVSGGMRAKVACALDVARFCEQCFIASGLEAGLLERFLAGEAIPGTRVKG